MQLIYHKTSWEITPMFLFDRKVEYVTEYIWHTSDSVKDLPCEFKKLKDFDVCSLDPGGMYCTKIPHKEFEIDGYKFDVQLSRIEEVLYCMSLGYERIPGYIRFPNWRWLIIIPKNIFNKLKAKLKELELSDEALNSELLEKEIKDQLYSNNIVMNHKKIIRPDGSSGM